jgi:hypothetical protein
MPRPLVLVHGYSADAKAFVQVRAALLAAAKTQKIELIDIDVCNYISLNNEITIKDIAEGFDRALGLRKGLSKGEEFDAIVHSTGMLVVRAWLANYGGPLSTNTRLKRLKHLVGLAPATWGSPQAHKGRTWLGALVKGNRELGPDFLNAGDRVLEGLELGGEFTWDLSTEDLLGDQPYYGVGGNTPYVTVFIGNSEYTGLSAVANSPGCDGTVRWAGCGLNTRKITVDLTRTGVDGKRVQMSNWADDRLDIPIIPVDGKSHATILSDPDSGMIDLVLRFLNVSSADDHAKWLTAAKAFGEKGMAKMLEPPSPSFLEGLEDDVKEGIKKLLSKAKGAKPAAAAMKGWQQFAVVMRDEWGDGIPDYLMNILRWDDGKKDWVKFENMYMDVHAYGPDQSYRCFYIYLPEEISKPGTRLCLSINASTGTDLMAYRAYTTAKTSFQLCEQSDPVHLEITNLGPTGQETLFYPFTTTMIEIMINREPVPFDKDTRVLNFEEI